MNWTKRFKNFKPNLMQPFRPLGALGLAGCSPKKSASDEKAASGEAGSATSSSSATVR